MKNRLLITGISTLLASLSPLALAHNGQDHSSFMTGLMHPLGGLDHLLAMIAVGLWAASLNKQARWLVPCAFVAAMLFGGALGVAGIHVPMVETGIVASVIVLGLLISLNVTHAVTLCSTIVAFFAVFHGVAHGNEMPLDAHGMAYAIGFALATMALHLAGMGLFHAMRSRQQPMLSRLLGGLIATAGVALAFI